MNLYIIVWKELSERDTPRQYTEFVEAADEITARRVADRYNNGAALDLRLYKIGSEISAELM